MKNKIIICCLISCFLAVFAATGANATFTTYTHSEDFFAALGSTPFITETYENYSVDMLIHPGDTLNGITYTAFPEGRNGRIDNIWDSLGNFGLAMEGGSNVSNFFGAGESFSVSFPWPVTAVSIFFNSATPDSDYRDLYIETTVGTAWTGGLDDYDISTTKGNKLFFAGLISDTPFTTATIGSASAELDGLPFVVDNLTFAPVPGTLFLLGSGLAGLGLWRLRKRFKA